MPMTAQKTISYTTRGFVSARNSRTRLSAQPSELLCGIGKIEDGKDRSFYTDAFGACGSANP